MAIRNLSRNFFELRNSAKANRTILFFKDDKDDQSSDSELLTSGEDSSTWRESKSSSAPLWVERIQEIEDDISKIQLRMRDLSALHTKRLLVNFESDEITQEREIDTVTKEITSHFRRVEGLLKRVNEAEEGRTIPPSEITLQNNIQKSMARKLQGLSIAFRNSQKEYLNRMQIQKSGSGSHAFEFLVNEKRQQQLPGLEIDDGFSTIQLQMLDHAQEIVDERDQEIQRIAKSIEELAQIFKELAVLVIDQGTLFDRIDFNMEQAVEHAKEGITQLTKAEENQKSASSFRCIAILLVLIAVMILLLILKHTSFKSSWK